VRWEPAGLYCRAITDRLMAPLSVCITVDFEPDCPPYLWTWRGITEGAPQLLDLFAEEAIAATYFTTGATAEQHPAAVEALVLGGHELACHGMTHRPFPSFDRETARDEIVESARRLRAFAPVTSFRAPYLRFPDAYLDLLEDAGFTLDSSQARYKAGYYRAAAPSRLTRVPASMTSSVLRLPSWLRDPWLMALRSPVVLFVHPWEFVDLSQEKLRFDCRFRTGRPALEGLAAVIRLFKARDARFVRMDTLGAELCAATA
jgi:peptidoglycan/xylan/chitin deacetylase (PgdA/CDA1 family)